MDDDAELANRASQGDMRAFTALVTRHEQRLRGFLARVAGPDRADDLAQDAFVKAWHFAGRFQGTGPYAAWLLRIGWRTFLDDQRARQRSPVVDMVAPERADPVDPDAVLDAGRVLGALDADERACLVLCLGQGWSHAEAADILGMPLGTLKSRLTRATRRARAMLEVPT